MIGTGQITGEPTQAIVGLSGKDKLKAKLQERRAAAKIRTSMIPRFEDAEKVLSFSQQRLWLLDQLMGASPVYNIFFAIRFQDKLNVEILNRCLETIVARHEALRTRFLVNEGNAKIMIDPPSRSQLAIERVSSSDEVYAIWRSEREYLFDIAKETLFRTRLLEEAENSHVLVVTMHHIVSDAWSLGVFFKELVCLYNDYSRGEPASLAELPIQFSDYAVWQRQWLTDEVLTEQLRYWQRQLADTPPLLMLPSDRPRPLEQRFNGATEAIHISADMTAALQQLSQAHGSTLFMSLLSVFAVLLGRYAGQNDIVIGTPIANRKRRETEDLIGFFVNTLVMRTDLSGDPTFVELLEKVRRTALRAYEHQDVPFEYLVEALNPERNLSYSPLFQVMFILQNVPVPTVAFNDVTMTHLNSEILAGYSRFDVTLSLAEGKDGLKGVFEYNTDLFDRSTIQRMADHYIRLLRAVISASESHISSFDFLSDEEKEQQLDWNDTDVPYESHCIHESVSAQAKRTPHVVAVLEGAASISFEALDNKARQLAIVLRRDGVRLGDRVGICMERSIDMVVAMLGVMKAGGAYVPLDPDYPAARIDYIIEDAELLRILSHKSVLQRQTSHSASRCKWWQLDALDLVDNDAAGLYSELPTNLHSDHAAYVIYTSGSTGVPKGVVGRHRSVMNRLLWMNDQYPVARGEVFSQKTSVSFVDHVAEIFQALTSGSQLVIVPNRCLQSPPEFLRALQQYDISRLTVVPSLLHALLSDQSSIVCASLRLLITSGEALVTSGGEQLKRRFPNVRLLNLYGSTEVGADVTSYEVKGLDHGAIPIGRAIANSQVYVLSSEGAKLPRGAVGELFIGGDGLAQGYLKKSSLTAERFVPDPFSHKPGARLFRTGDLVRYRESGDLDYLGRADHQVKIRGFRIELGEIDAALRAHSAVESAITTVRATTHGDAQLVSYVVPNMALDRRVLTAQLKEHLQGCLPHYMVPAAVQYLAALPLNSNGKVDRRALPTPPASVVEHEEPMGEYETLLAGLWCDVLHCKQAGRHDNFFELGGHSLLVTQLISRIRGSFGIDLPLLSVFEHQTLQAQAQLIMATTTGATGVSAEGVDSGNSAGVILSDQTLRSVPQPLSFSQQRLWFLDRLMGPNPSYNIPLVLRLQGELDASTLERSLNHVIERHESLRTRFVECGGEGRQLVEPYVKISLMMELLPDEKALQRAVHEDRMHCFDLRGDSLFRVRLLRLENTGEQQHILLVTLHHIIADGWSIGIFFRELIAAYRAYQAGEPLSVAPLNVQYLDFAAWQRARLNDGGFANQLAYWQEQLADLPPVLNLPTDRPRPAEQSYRGSGVRFTFSADLLAALHALSRQQGVTLFMTLLSAYALLLRRYTGQDDIAVGTAIANRTRRETEPVIGFFTNTLVMRNNLADNSTFVELLKRTRATALNAYAHQDLPFERLVEALNPIRSLSHSPLFQVMFVLQNMPMDMQKLEGLSVSSLMMEEEENVARFDLNLAMGEVNGELSGRMEYNSDLFCSDTITRMLGHFQRLLEAVVRNADTPISEYEILSAVERRQLLVQWNGQCAVYSPNRCIHELFEAQVEQDPSAIAVVYENRQLTYGELNGKANQVARFLRARGVKPDTLVALFMERSAEMVVGLLGTLKAGGAYVPIDPAYPPERIRYMLEDAGVEWILTQTRVAELLPITTQRLLCLDRHEDAEENARLSLQPLSNLPTAQLQLTASHLAYVIYTSGSTGKPKGVLVEHRNVVQLLHATNDKFQFNSRDTWTLFHSIAFDFSVWEVWGALIYGGKLIVVPKAVAQSPPDFYELVYRHKVTVLNQTPSAFSGFIAMDQQYRSTLSLRAVIFGGEKLKPSMLRPWVARHGDQSILLINMYGITETTIHVTYKQLLRNEIDNGDCSLIGRQLPHLKLYVLDGKTVKPVPIGVAGEMYVGGSGVARGYLNQLELTAHKFIADPFSDEPGERLYRSGDLARWLADGTLEFIGRLDDQIKIRGFRIEPGEIEAQLAQHPQVHSCVVLALEDAPGDKRLVAYVVLDQMNETAEDPAEALRKYLMRALPDYMVPSAYVALDRLPLTSNGKLDRARLPRPDESAYARTHYVAPKNSLEEQLVELWRRNLNLDRVGTHDNYFAIGGDSIRSISLVAEGNRMGIAFRVKDLFIQPTIVGLAQAIADGKVDQIQMEMPEAFDLVTAEEMDDLIKQFS